jgi:hypothetical protein
MLSRQEEEQERIETLRNDQRVREQQQAQGSTFHQHAQSAANDTGGGRFASLGAPTVTGATAIPKYPAAGAHQSDPVGIEPPLGFSVNDMPGLENPAGSSSGVLQPVEPGAPAAESAPPSELVPPLADDVEPGAGAPPSNKRSE